MVSATTGASRTWGTRDVPGRDVRVLYWGVSAAWLVTLIWLISSHSEQWTHAGVLLAWVAVLAITNLMPVQGLSAHFAADLPIAIAAALLLSPPEVAVVAFLGAWDPREIRGKIGLSKALYNRSQVGVAFFLGSLSCHALVQEPASSPSILALAFLALTVVTLVNYIAVGVPLSIERGRRLIKVVQGLRLGALPDFLLAMFAWGVLAAMLAALYNHIDVWALPAFLGPTLLARQTLTRSQMWIEAAAAYRSREKALFQLSNQIEAERSDERRLIAADLHDEVLQPLYKVTLMSHVIKADLASGRLLEIDEDLPELLTAAEIASGTLRALIGDLRRSALGGGGLSRTLSKLIRGMAERTSVTIVDSIDEVEAAASIQLAFYQIGKEALANAVEHSKASAVTVELMQEESHLTLRIRDNGIGFDPQLPKEGHYGIHIMRERAASVGATFFLDASPGQGCTITVIAAHDREGGAREDR